ncbi:MAG: hypothetical protein EAZ53_01800 [Bacteroidetes bacterium]|nr:MAG: hypothetical protein EAZ53_01800 [Bacteroidota bacterium]
MGEIIISDFLDQKLKNMVYEMYVKNYFRFWDSSEEYVNHIYEFIKTIPSQPLKTCKNPIFGKYYARYDNPKSKMKYYITYFTFDDIYYIEDIISPKTPAYTLIMGLD